MVISSLSLGGAERVTANMANCWAAKGLKVTLVTFDDGSVPPVYPLAPQVGHITLGVAGHSSNSWMGLWNNLKRVFVLRKLIRSQAPDVVISFLDTTNVLSLLAAKGTGIPVIVTELSDPAMVPIGLIWGKMRLLTYASAGRVVVLSRRAQTYFPPKIRDNTEVLPNPILLDDRELESRVKIPKPAVVTMGRFSKEKRIDVLLQAFALLKDRHPDWILMIFGSGPLRDDLVKLGARLGLNGRVQFPGLVPNPHQYLKLGDLFVLTSRFEGFPMALVEAMALGLPAVTTEYHEGVREIVDHGKNGLVVTVDDMETLVAAMDRLMGDEGERHRFGMEARKIIDRFGLEKVMEKWEKLIRDVRHEAKK
jgi:GalNAc-alpha-(1->4)-GalNAc-alpha-(1->3)-diNAcBac-PP-undecaprenol alpha-1,4-N-acetyl-D-galactosaminyltransferase